MIKPPMTTVIAERELDAHMPGSKSKSITVQIGMPSRDPNPNGDWYCPIRIIGLGRERGMSFFGIDSLQALQFAMGILDLEASLFEKNAKLSWLGQKKLGLRPLVLKEEIEGKKYPNKRLQRTRKKPRASKP